MYDNFIVTKEAKVIPVTVSYVFTFRILFKIVKEVLTYEKK